MTRSNRPALNSSRASSGSLAVDTRYPISARTDLRASKPYRLSSTKRSRADAHLGGDGSCIWEPSIISLEEEKRLMTSGSWIMNGDGALDVLVVGQESNNVVWYENRLTPRK